MAESTLNLFSEELQQEPQHIDRLRLTNRQYRLHNMLLEHSKRSRGRLSLKDMLKRLDSEYGFTDEMLEHPKRTLNNLSARRRLSDDLDVITTFGDFHKVYVGGRYATSELEIKIHLLKEEIRIKKEWWKLQTKRKKAGLNGQMIMQFSGYEKEEWESYIRKEEQRLKDMEVAYESEDGTHTHRA